VSAQPEQPTSLNLATHFLDANLHAGRGGRTALIDGTRVCSFAELASLTNQVGNGLTELGVCAQQRVLLALADSVELVATWYAAQKIGAVTAEVYTFLQPKDYAYYVDYTAAAVVVADGTTLERVREALQSTREHPILLVIDVEANQLRDGELDFTSLVARQATTLAAAPIGPDDIALWKFTTGSTGKPKACVHTARSPLASYQGYARGVLGMCEDDLVLPVPKLFFGYARDLAAMFPFGAGAAGLIFAERTTADLIFELIAHHRPTILVNVPTMMQAMLDHPSAAAQDLSCLRLCTSAGEALPEPLHRRWIDTFGIEVLDGIGSSEAYHIFISNRPGRSRPGSIGEVVPGYAAAVVDDDGRQVADGSIGRLWVRGESAALMYWGDEDASAATFAPGLVMTGDLVERDAEGYFMYRGRADDLLKVGGIFVAPAEIERCLATHPDVVECAVVAAEHDGLTRSCAFVVVRPSAEATSEGMQAFVRERLAPHKVPREVRFVSGLPRTGSGKIDRTALRVSLGAGDRVDAGDGRSVATGGTQG
jgi:benzoate-CoA ligase family protein